MLEHMCMGSVEFPDTQANRKIRNEKKIDHSRIRTDKLDIFKQTFSRLSKADIAEGSRFYVTFAKVIFKEAWCVPNQGEYFFVFCLLENKNRSSASFRYLTNVVISMLLIQCSTYTGQIMPYFIWSCLELLLHLGLVSSNGIAWNASRDCPLSEHSIPATKYY